MLMSYIPVAHPYIPPAIAIKRQSSETEQVQVQSEPYPYYKDNDEHPLPWWAYVLLLILACVVGYVGRFK